MNFIKIAATSFFIIMTSCKNNPYPTDTIFESVGKKVEKVRQEPLLFLNVPAVMKFVEGEEGVYKMEGIAPSGKPLIEAYNLPDGASFDPVTNELKWMPGFSTVPNLRNLESNYREHTVNFQLYDKDNPLLFLQKEASLIVFDKPQEIVIETDENATFHEEEEHNQNIVFNNQDGTKAFVRNIYSEDLPEGATFYEITNGREYRLTFKPNAYFVTASDTKDSEGNRYKDVSFVVEAVGSDTNISTKVVKWRIYDKKKPIEIFAPYKITTDGDVFFTVNLVDRNGERSPTLEAEPRPTYKSHFLIKKTIFSQHYGHTGEKWSYYTIHWKNIPSSKRGKVYKLNFKTCAHHYRGCRRFFVDINLTDAKKRSFLDWNSNNPEEKKIEEVESVSKAHGDYSEDNNMDLDFYDDEL